MSANNQNELTRKQREFYMLMFMFKRHHGVPPTMREMQALGDFRSPRSVGQYLEALEVSGYIERSPGARNIRFLRQPPADFGPDRADTVEVPVVGRVAAGLPILAEENVTRSVRVSREIARGHHTYFLLEVHGDSMNRAGIKDGDVVLVRQQPIADPGEIVVALLDDSATIKRIRFANDTVVLEPVSTNPTHKPILLQNDFQIQGVVVNTFPGAAIAVTTY